MANYPVLLVSVTNPVPDDSSLSTLPRGQVDYLSHDWQEADIWRSWRNMTRQKNEIANGVRLENASWRTWWKQRNKLKTVTPETLNWLKDSDVTWLYGPLHTADPWSPPPKPPPEPLPADDADTCSVHDTLDLHMSNRKKPILKHRSISEMLTSDLPSPLFSPVESEDEGESVHSYSPVQARPWTADQPADAGQELERSRTVTANAGPPNRPSLIHTKSDTHITRWGGNRTFRKDSPPRLYAAQASNAVESSEADSNLTPGSIVATASTSSSSGKKKHISFNTFVEQYIAIEKPKKLEDSSYDVEYGRRPDCYYDDGYEEDSERGDMDDDEDEHDMILFPEDRPPSDSNSESEEEDEDDVLEMRVSSGRRTRPSPGRSSSSSTSTSSSSSRNSASRSSRLHSGSRQNSLRPPLVRQNSTDKTPHVTIAPIAPTILKTTDVGADYGFDMDEDTLHGNPNHYHGKGVTRTFDAADMPVELVYVPPMGSNYSLGNRQRSTSSDKMHPVQEESADVYHHRESYFSVGTPPSSAPTAQAQPPPQYLVQPEEARPVMAVQGVGEDAYDYFSGPDFEDFEGRRVPNRSYSGKRSESSNDAVIEEVREDDEDGRGRGIVRQQDLRGRAPDVIVNGGRQAEEQSSPLSSRSRSRSRSRSKSRTPSPVDGMSSPSRTTQAVPIPPSKPATVSPECALPSHPGGSSLLSPPDSHTGRGRTMDARTRSSSTPSLSSSAEGRGRSLSRTPSFSDRDRSGSRSTNSPLGSLSPDGSGVLYSQCGTVLANGRRREPTKKLSGNSGNAEDSRPLRLIAEGSSTPSFTESPLFSPTASVSSASSTSVSSTSTVKAPRPSLHLDQESMKRAKDSPPAIPSAVPEEEEEEQQRSLHPTPSNSPILSFRPVSVPLAVPNTTQSLSSATGVMSRSPPSSPVKDTIRDNNLVTRAVEMVSSASTFLGSMLRG